MKTLLISMLVVISSPLYAYQYFPLVNKGGLAAEVSAQFRSLSYEENKGLPAKSEISGQGFGGSFELQYGVFQNVSIFGKLGYSSLDKTTTAVGSPDQKFSQKGIEDIEIGLRGKFDVLGNFLWGGSMLISPGSQTREVGTNSLDLSNNSGGFIAVPKLGYQFMISRIRVGVVGSYDFILGNRRLEETDTLGASVDYNVKNGGRTIIDGFGELHVGEVDLIGVSVASINVEKSTRSTGTLNVSVPGESYLRVKTYGRKAWGSVWLQPYVDFNRDLDSDISSEIDFSIGTTLRVFF